MGVLITIECRRHNDRKGVTWIEQLTTKKRKIGAAVTIAVSKAGFTGPAFATAAQEGIVPRTLQELSQEGFTWLRLAFHEAVIQSYWINQVEVELYDAAEHEGAELTNNQVLLEQCRAEGKKYPVLIKLVDASRYDVDYVMLLARSQGFDPWEDCNGELEKDRILTWENHDRGISIETSQGNLAVKTIRLRYCVKVERTLMPVDQLFRHSSPGGRVSEGVQFTLPQTKDAKLVMMRKGKSGEIQCEIVARQIGTCRLVQCGSLANLSA